MIAIELIDRNERMSFIISNARIELSRLPEYATLLYRKAPTSVVTIGSIVISYLFRIAYDDYQLFKALGKGGLGKPSILTWLIHTIALRPIALPKRAAIDVNTFPLDDPEWKSSILSGLPKRKGERPFVFGMVPHRQLEAIAPQGGNIQKAIIDHLSQIAKENPDCITLALSTYEATDSPCLYVKHGDGSSAKPSTMAQFYLAGTPPPHLALPDEKDKVLPRDPTKHELAHIHLSEGSMHLTLSPQDARKVVKEGYGERHRLAGMAYRGNYIPPYWLPSFVYNLIGGEANVRWSYQQVMLNKIKSGKVSMEQGGKLIPPTYTCVYAPTNEEELQWTLKIIDSSVAWALGKEF